MYLKVKNVMNLGAVCFLRPFPVSEVLTQNTGSSQCVK